MSGDGLEVVCGVESEFDYVSCQRPAGHEDRHSGVGEDGGWYVWKDTEVSPQVSTPRG